MQVVKKQGLIIQPINYEDVDPHERGEEHRGSGQKQRQNQRIIRSQGRVKAVVAKS
jgi:U3 small nucleolar RNA-associated protein 14